MLKCMGCIFILIAGCGFGISNSFLLKKQLEQLISFQDTLYLLEGEMKYFKRPLPEAFAIVAQEKKEPYGKVFDRIANGLLECKYAFGSEVWRKVFFEYKKEFICTEEEFSLFLKTGFSFKTKLSLLLLSSQENLSTFVIVGFLLSNSSTSEYEISTSCL